MTFLQALVVNIPSHIPFCNELDRYLKNPATKNLTFRNLVTAVDLCSGCPERAKGTGAVWYDCFMAQTEMIDVVDESGKVIDTMSLEETEHLNHLIQNVIVFIFNSKGEVWIQKRPMNKKHFPGLWDVSACGAVSSGESPNNAAKRETKEEMGISPKLKFAESFLNVFPGHDGKHSAVYRIFTLGLVTRFQKKMRKLTNSKL